MLKNELYQGNKKPEVAKPAGDKSGERTPAEDAAVKSRIDAAWGDKAAAGQSSEFVKTAGDKPGERTPAEDAAVKSRIDAAWGDKPAAGQTPSAYPQVKPIIK